jgi:hypothetical protein
MDEGVQEIVTDLMQRQPLNRAFLAADPAVALAERKVGVAVSAFFSRVFRYLHDRGYQ